MKLAELVDRLRPPLPDTAGAVLPDGVKLAAPFAGGFVLVHQTPPRVWQLRWITDESEAEFGPEATYRHVRIAMPYLIVVAVFEGSRRSAPGISHRNECFFSNRPLERERLDTPLCYPALLNCSKLPLNEGKPLSWICTQHLPGFSGRRVPDLNESIGSGLERLLRHLMESSFNRSSEHHEGASGFSASVEAGIDPRIADIDAWQAATEADPTFAVEVPWLPTGHTLGQIIDRIRTGRKRRATTTADIARLVLGSARRKARA
jgi:hypothetical protein